MSFASTEVLRDIVNHRALLAATTRIELEKRYAGSVLGSFWVILNPLLFLSVYLFLYLVVFKVRLPQMSELDFSIYVFAGLVPYIAFMEVASTSVQIIKSNSGLIRNLVFPIALVPTRVVIAVIVSQFVGLMMVIVLAIINEKFNIWGLPYLVVVLFFQFLFLLGVSFFLSALGVMMQDFTYVLGSLLLFILFITPIGFKADAVPARLRLVVDLNPFYYMSEVFRAAIVSGYGGETKNLLIFGVISLFSFFIGAAFFRRFRAHLIDYE